ncbi:MAG: FecR domain-containing protein [Bacteroidales bacterium]|nr:FecR domain-containing protein [Bacteroidales bacterium]
MLDIFNILAKHFQKRASGPEEKQANEFRRKNSIAYGILEALWNRKDLEVKEYDSVKAWYAVQEKVADQYRKPGKVLPLYKKLSRIAAVAALFIIGSISAYYLLHTYQTSKTIVAQISPAERGKEIWLSDGSKIWLNGDAILTYPEKFGSSERDVELVGEAFFEVSRNPGKPFIVHTSNSSIAVLGTSFNIASGTQKTVVTVTTGKVKVMNADRSNKVIITKGYSASVSENQVEKYQTANPNYLSWKTGEFIFKNVEIREVIEDLNTYYQKRIVIADSSETICFLTAGFKKAKLQEIIEVLELACNIDVVDATDNYLIY